jgi:septal ring factor EnvC (AmiA/AmiB activator)
MLGFLVCATLDARRSPLDAQQPSRVRQQREELDKLRTERSRLEQRLRQLQTSVRDLDEERSVLDRQADVAARVVRTLEDQLLAINEEVQLATDSLSRAEGELRTRRGALQSRLVDIYKRGPLYTFEALLSAHSFGELVARYKYLHQLARHDRFVVQRVELLHGQIARQRETLVRLRNTIDMNRQDKALEEERLRALERQRAQSARSTRRVAEQTGERLAQLKRDEARLGGIISAAINAERARVSTTTRAPSGGASRTSSGTPSSSIRTSDVGQLDWPVQGSIIYDFGRAQKANNTAIRWNGIGIAAPMNTPVRAVAPGKVLEVTRAGTYGLTVIVEHGGGDFSLYSSLADASVLKGASIAKGQQVGTVGTTDPELPPHLHFEIRRGGPAVDPKGWLRARR